MYIADKIDKYLKVNEGPIWGKLKATARHFVGKSINKKPSWSEAPKWANYLALYPAGGWTWQEKKSVPWKEGNEWAWPDAGKTRWDGHVDNGKLSKGDAWEKTLEKRP